MKVQTGGFTQTQFLTGIVPAADFSVPALGTDGNLGRNAFQGPNFERIDTALTKVIPIAERFNLRFRAEPFNLFNFVDLNAPSGALNSASFGKVTGAANPRQMSLSLMLKF